jgi:ketosteroid isomerase-like protein
MLAPEEDKMKRRTLLLIGLLMCSAIAFAKEKKAAAVPAAAPPNYKAMVQAEYDLWSTMDSAKVSPMFAPDADLIFFDITPLKYNGWSEYQKGVMKVFEPYQTMKCTVNDDVHGGRSGNMAWTASTVACHAQKKDGGVDDMTLRTTEIWQKRGAKWLIVHEHASVPMKE